MPSALPKVHREFFQIPMACPGEGWTRLAADSGAIDELVLADNLDTASRTGSRTRLARWMPGTRIGKPVIHDFHEEVLVVEGDFIVGCDAQGHGGSRFGPYTFACRPPQVWHGPFATQNGCLLFEIQYYAP